MNNICTYVNASLVLLIRGLKIFWLIPPTEENLLIYLDWVRSKDKKKFLPDITDGCVRLEVGILLHGVP